MRTDIYIRFSRSPPRTMVRPAAMRQQGLSMIELMVGLLVGLIVALVVLSTVATVSIQRRNTVGGNDAKLSGQFALSRLEYAARLAGLGLYNNGQLICSSINSYYKGAVTTSATLTPVKIVDGGTTGSDTITFTYGNAIGGNSISSVVKQMPNSSSIYTVTSKGNLAVNDMAIIGVPGSAFPCTLFQVTGFPPGGGNCNGISASCLDIQHNPSSDYNPSNGGKTWPNAPNYSFDNSGGNAGPAIVSRLGTFVNDTYEILCNSLVAHKQSDAASCSSPSAFTNATPLASNIVQMKAQYGISASAASNVVISWQSATAPTWNNPSATDFARVKAIRIAIVSRSIESGVGNVSTACTNAAGIANTGPCSFQDSESPKIDLSMTTKPTNMSWSNYRYRVYESVIPLRNVLWNS